MLENLVNISHCAVITSFIVSLQARGGHNEAAKYLIAKGADVTAVDENGDTALTVAKTPSMVRLLKGKRVRLSRMSHIICNSCMILIGCG